MASTNLVPSSESPEKPTEPEQRPPAIVRTCPEIDAITMAQGFRLAEKDKYIAVTAATEPGDIFTKQMVDQSGDSFCRRVIYHIACLNHADVTNFAHDFSLKFRDNPQHLLDLVRKQPSDIFSSDEVAKHGLLFLKAVLWHCVNALHRLEEHQMALKADVAAKTTSQSYPPPNTLTTKSTLAPSETLGHGPSPVLVKTLVPPQDGRRIRSEGNGQIAHSPALPQKRIVSETKSEVVPRLSRPPYANQTLPDQRMHRPSVTNAQHSMSMRMSTPQFAVPTPRNGFPVYQTARRVEAHHLGPRHNARVPAVLETGFMPTEAFHNQRPPVHDNRTPYGQKMTVNHQFNGYADTSMVMSSSHSNMGSHAHQGPIAIGQQHEAGLHYGYAQLDVSRAPLNNMPYYQQYAQGPPPPINTENYNPQSGSYARNYGAKPHSQSFRGNANRKYSNRHETMQGGTRPSGAWERSAPGDNGRKTSNEHKQQGFPQSQPRRNSFRKSRRTSDASQGLEPFPEYVDADHQGQFAVEQPAPDVKYWSSKHHIGLGADDVTCLWVGGISPDVFEDQLKEIFSQAGPVEITSIRHDIQKKMRVCFVKYATAAQAREALKFAGILVNGLKISVQVPDKYCGWGGPYRRTNSWGSASGRPVYGPQDHRKSTAGSHRQSSGQNSEFRQGKRNWTNREERAGTESSTLTKRTDSGGEKIQSPGEVSTTLAGSDRILSSSKSPQKNEVSHERFQGEIVLQEAPIHDGHVTINCNEEVLSTEISLESDVVPSILPIKTTKNIDNDVVPSISPIKTTKNIDNDVCSPISPIKPTKNVDNDVYSPISPIKSTKNVHSDVSSPISPVNSTNNTDSDVSLSQESETPPKTVTKKSKNRNKRGSKCKSQGQPDSQNSPKNTSEAPNQVANGEEVKEKHSPVPKGTDSSPGSSPRKLRRRAPQKGSRATTPTDSDQEISKAGPLDAMFVEALPERFMIENSDKNCDGLIANPSNVSGTPVGNYLASPKIVTVTLATDEVDIQPNHLLNRETLSDAESPVTREDFAAKTSTEQDHNAIAADVNPNSSAAPTEVNPANGTVTKEKPDTNRLIAVGIPPRQIDDWVNPFSRQKNLQKQQKQAAKKQKKKEKKKAVVQVAPNKASPMSKSPSSQKTVSAAEDEVSLEDHMSETSVNALEPRDLPTPTSSNQSKMAEEQNSFSRTAPNYLSQRQLQDGSNHRITGGSKRSSPDPQRSQVHSKLVNLTKSKKRLDSQDAQSSKSALEQTQISNPKQQSDIGAPSSDDKRTQGPEPLITVVSQTAGPSFDSKQTESIDLTTSASSDSTADSLSDEKPSSVSQTSEYPNEMTATELMASLRELVGGSRCSIIDPRRSSYRRPHADNDTGTKSPVPKLEACPESDDDSHVVDLALSLGKGHLPTPSLSKKLPDKAMTSNQGRGRSNTGMSDSSLGKSRAPPNSPIREGMRKMVPSYSMLFDRLEQEETNFMDHSEKAAPIPNPQVGMPFGSQGNSEPMDPRPAKKSKKKNRKRKTDESQKGSPGDSASSSSSKEADKNETNSPMKDRTGPHNKTVLAVGENEDGRNGGGKEMDGATKLGENKANAESRITWAELLNKDNAKLRLPSGANFDPWNHEV